MPPIKITANPVDNRDEQLALFKTMIIALLLKAGGSVTFTEAEWPETQPWSFVHGMDDTGTKLVITLTKE